MTSSRPSGVRNFTDAELARYLNDNSVTSDSDGELEASETEDYLEVEDAEQTDEDDEPMEVISTSSPNVESSVNFEESTSRQNLDVSSDACIIHLPQTVLRGKNRHVWSTKRPQSLRTPSSNIVRISRGPTPQCRREYNPLKCFEMFITNEIICEVVQWTNAEIQVKQQNYAVIRRTQQTTDKCEIRALIGLLVLTAAFKDNHLSSDELFDASFSGSRYVTTMSKDRFEFLLQCLRFDDKSLRLSHQNRDRFVPIRKVWDLFIEKCKTNYDVGMYVTIDEQLLAFRGRCPFRMYIPNKPAKYGIKIVMICDTGTKYMVNATPYLGKSTETGGLPLGEYFVKQLTQPLHGSNRNITSDNWFTSIPLAKSLLSQPYKLTLVGTLRANKREIPNELKNSRTRPTGTSIFCYDGPLTLLSYKPKTNKVVHLLSSCSEEGTINERTKKPNMVEFYNQTKGGVDTLDQMCSNMSCSRKTNRWPMCLFYGMLNIAFVNSYVIYCENKLNAKEKPLNRKKFMRDLHMQLVNPYLEKRLSIPTLSKRLKDSIQDLVPTNTGEDTSQREEDPDPKKRKRCSLCSYKKNRMTKVRCLKCQKNICGEHKVEICVNCAKLE